MNELDFAGVPFIVSSKCKEHVYVRHPQVIMVFGAAIKHSLWVTRLKSWECHNEIVLLARYHGTPYVRWGIKSTPNAL